MFDYLTGIGFVVVSSMCYEASGYEVEGFSDANHDLGKLYIAQETALNI